MVSSTLYWLVVVAVLLAAAVGHSMYQVRLKRKGYWVRDGDSLLLPILIAILLAALGLPKLIALIAGRL